MKKLVIATLLATAAGLASAQTIYGVLDMGITTATNAESTTKRATGMSNGGLSAPRFGITGSEDLGNGLKASFTLESEILNDTGAQGDTTYLFNRGAFLKLDQAGVGSLRAGRINRHDYTQAVKYDAFGGGNIGGWTATSAGTVDLKVRERIANAVEIQTAPISGLQLTAQYGFGEVAGAIEAGRTVALGAEYTVGNGSVAYTYTAANASTGAYLKTKTNSVYASYNFGVAKTNAGWANVEVDGTAAKVSGWFVGAAVPVTTKVTALAQYNQYDNDAGLKPSVYSVGATYAFSKRTTGYVIGARSNQDGNSAQQAVSTSKYNGFDTPPAGANQTVASVGVRHTF